MHDDSNPSCASHLRAQIIAANASMASIQLNASQRQSCKTCTERGGCQSLSVYHWFFEKQTLELHQHSENPYQMGEQLAVTFPDKLLQHAVGWLIGLPLVGFLLGIATTFFTGELGAFTLATLFASAAFMFARKRLQRRLSQAIQITRC